MSQNVKGILENIEVIFNASEKVLGAMDDGERIQLKDLAQVVGIMVSMEPKNILHFVSYFAHNTELAYVTRGKKGGVIKGQKNKKVDTDIVVNDTDVVPTDIDDI